MKKCRWCRWWAWDEAYVGREHQVTPICVKRIRLFPDHAEQCRMFEREPGSDDE